MSSTKRSGEPAEEEQVRKRSKRSVQLQGQRVSRINLVYPFLNANSLSITPPFINVGNGLDISDLTLKLRIGEGLYFNDGALSVVGTNEFRTMRPLLYDQGVLTLPYNEPLFMNAAGQLTMPGVNAPLQLSNENISLLLSNGLTSDNNGLTLNLDPVFFPLNDKYMLNCGPPLTKENNILNIKAGNGLALEGDQLECTLNVVPPLQRNADVLSLSAGNGLSIQGDQLECSLNVTAPLQRSADIVSLNAGNGLGIISNRLECTLQVTTPLIRTANIISLNIGPSLRIVDGKLEVNDVAALAAPATLAANNTANKPVLAPPIKYVGQKIGLNFSNQFAIENGQLTLKVAKSGGLKLTSEGLAINFNPVAVSTRPVTKMATTATLFLTNEGIKTMEDIYPVQELLLTTVNRKIKICCNLLTLGKNKIIDFKHCLVLENNIRRPKPIQIDGMDFASRQMDKFLSIPLVRTAAFTGLTSYTSCIIRFVTNEGQDFCEMCQVRLVNKFNNFALYIKRCQNVNGTIKYVIFNTLPTFFSFYEDIPAVYEDLLRS